MKKILLLLILVVGTRTSMQAQNIKKVKIEDLTALIDSSTTPLVINFWASWCAPCVHEIPWFEKTVSDYADKNVRLILVSLDFEEDYPKKLQSFIKKKDIRSEVVWLNETDANYFCSKIDKSWDGVIPASLFINNTIRYRLFINGQITEPQLKTQLGKML